MSGVSTSPQVGDRLQLKRFRLESGMLTLMLTSSVRVELIAPVEAEFESDMRLRLYDGRLCADVGDRGKGFTVVTDAGKVIDLGTRFSVEADRHGESRVAVFSGEVEFHPQNSLEHGEPVTLTEGEALRFSARAGLRRWQQVALAADRAGLSGAAEFGVVQGIRDNLGDGELRPFYGVIAGGMRPGALAFTDKPNPVWIKTPGDEFPPELKGADLVRTYYRFKNKKDYELTITLSRTAEVFVLLVNPSDPPNWLFERFEPTGTRVRSGPWHQGLASHPAVVAGPDGNFLDYEVWKCMAGPGELTLGPPQGNKVSGVEPLMYGVAVKARNNE